MSGLNPNDPQKNPFDSDYKLPPIPAELAVIPPESDTSNPEYNAFLDPESPYFGLSPNWSRTTQRPFPTMRCAAIKKSGEQCLNRAMRGTGLTVGSTPQCRKHGGNLPNVAKHAKAITEAARLQITDSVPDAVRIIQELMMDATSGPAVRLKAATELLDRANVKGQTEISVEVTHHEKPSEKLMKKLDAMRKTEEEEVIDAEEVFEDLGETKKA